MSLTRLKRVAISGAVTTALAAGGLAATTAPAHAATATANATYTCGSPLLSGLPAPLNTLGSFKIPATFTLQNLPTVLTANVPVPAGVPIIGSFQLPTTGGLTGILQGLQITLASVLGTTPLSPVSVAFNSAAAPVINGVATVEGQLGAFTPGGNGLPLPIPTSFDASLLTNNPLFALLGVKCNLDPGTTFNGGGGGGTGTGGITIVKQDAKIKAKAARKVVKQGGKVVVTVKVKTSAGQKGVGQISAKAKGKKAKLKSLSNGKIRMTIRGVTKLGKNKIKIKFLGNDYTNSAKKKVTVRVVR